MPCAEGDPPTLLLAHRERALADVLPAAGEYVGRPVTGLPAGRALLELPREQLVSVAVLAVAGSARWAPLPPRWTAPDIRPIHSAQPFCEAVLEVLRRRRLPFTVDDVVLLLALSLDPFDQVALAFAVAAAEQVLAAAPGDQRVVEALRAAMVPLADEPLHRHGLAGLRRKVRVLVAAHPPGGLLDLSAVEVQDGWGPRVRAAATEAAETWAGVQEFLVLCGALTQSRPGARWHASVRAMVQGSYEAGELVRRMLQGVVDAELSRTPDDELDLGGSTRLLSRSNAMLARAATLAAGYVDAPWVSQLLSQVALRGAAAHPEPFVTEALCARAASGAVDALAARAAAGDQEARGQLELLFTEIRRRDLLTRIASGLGMSETVAEERKARVAREKQRNVAARSRPGPRQAQSALSKVTRRLVRPLLAEAGFTETRGRTFLRRHDDHVAAVMLGVADTDVVVELGIWFGAELTGLDVATVPREAVPPIWGFDVRGQLDGPEGSPGGGRWPVRLDRPGLEERMGPVLESLAGSGLRWLAAWGGTAVTLSRLRDNDWRDPRGTSTFAWGATDLVDVLTRLEETRRSS